MNLRRPLLSYTHSAVRAGQKKKRHSGMLSWLRLAFIGFVAGSVAGCVTIDAPDKPIVIELNINIKQEVIFKLDRASKQLIDEKPEIF
jgi:hypothetical protein